MPISTTIGRVVPWSSTKEWSIVRDQILSLKPVELEQAQASLIVWILRCDMKHCPAYIEATEHLVRALVLDARAASLVENGQLIETFGGAINKFVQLFLERRHQHQLQQYSHDRHHCKRKKDFALNNKQLAEELGIPTWIIDVRNDCAHHFRSSLFLLRQAANILLQWLVARYWEQNQPSLVAAPSEPEESAAFKDILKEYLDLSLAAGRRADEKHLHSTFERLCEAINKDQVAFIKYVAESELLVTAKDDDADPRQLEELASIPLAMRRAWLPIFHLLRDRVTGLFVELFGHYKLPKVILSGQIINPQMRLVLLWLQFLLSDMAVVHGDAIASFLDTAQLICPAGLVCSLSTKAILKLLMEHASPPVPPDKRIKILEVYRLFEGKNSLGAPIDIKTFKMTTLEEALCQTTERQMLLGTYMAESADTSSSDVGVMPGCRGVGNLRLNFDVSDFVPFSAITPAEQVCEEARRLIQEVRDQEEEDAVIPELDVSLYYQRRKQVLGGRVFWQSVPSLGHHDSSDNGSAMMADESARGCGEVLLY